MKVLDLYITRVCNLSCDYCYIDVLKKESQEFQSQDFLLRIDIRQYDHIKFLWGEPLVRWKQIQEIVIWVRKIKKDMKFSVVTNGILLDNKKTLFLQEYKIDVLISIHEGSFPHLKKKQKLLNDLQNIICFYIIFDPKALEVALKKFLYFFKKWFTNFSFAPEIYSNWNDINIAKLEKVLFLLLPYIHKNNINISWMDPYSLKVLNRACEKTVYNENGEFSPCNRFNSLEKNKNFRYKDIYDTFDKEIHLYKDPLRWFYICPIWWYLDHEEENHQQSLQSFKKLNHVFINFYRNIYNQSSHFLTKSIKEIRFNLTQQCNLRCHYCYVDFKDKILSEQVWKNIIDFFLEQEGKNKKISFFWGEPMLEFSLLEKLVFYSEKKSQFLKKEVKYSLATNFTLVTQKRIDFLQKYRFDIHISFNGNISTNNRMRDKSSELVLANISKYFSKKDRKKICILFAFSPQNIDKIENNLIFLIEKGIYLFNIEMIFWKEIQWQEKDIKRSVFFFQKVQKLYPHVDFVNTHEKHLYLDIDTEWNCRDNSLEFYSVSIDRDAKQLFDTLMSRYL